jgi:hypothetical protein
VTVETWVAERLAGAPEVLRNRVLNALQRWSEEGKVKGEESTPPFTLCASPFTHLSELRAAAGRLLAESRSAPPSRDTALTLLAADALITLAVEAELNAEGGGVDA